MVESGKMMRSTEECEISRSCHRGTFSNAACAFDREDFPDHPLYSGNPWFLPLVGTWYRLRDKIDRAVG